MNQLPENLYTTDKIRLYSGHYVNPLRMTADDVGLKDIAHGLAHRCRFAGHTQRFYSVAAHSMRVAELVPVEYRLTALLHDASEAYLFDIPTPLKRQLPGLVQIEEHVMHTIALKFRFPWPMPDIVKQADKAVLEEEWQGLVLSSSYPMFQRTSPADIRECFFRMVTYELQRHTLKPAKR